IVTVSNKLAKQYFPHTLSSSAQHFLLLPVREAWKMILLETTHNLELKWRRSVYPYYETKLMNKWPYANMTSSNERAFYHFIEPETGLLWRFVNDELSAYITFEADHWVRKIWLGEGLPFTNSFLSSLEKAFQLSQLHSASQNVNVPIQVNMNPTPGISQYTLQSGDFRLNYRNGPQEWQNLNMKLGEYSHVELFVIATNGRESLISADGPGALLNLLNQGIVQFLNDNIVRVSWPINLSQRKYTITILFRSEGDILKLLLHDELNFKNKIFQ
ncbi:MAG: type VI secretion IcmF C-terminal domain-containing protein, partial [Gammaproteobacteria bacterium]